jgi:hypothetical protein
MVSDIDKNTRGPGEDMVKHFIVTKLQYSTDGQVYITLRQQHHQQLQTYLRKRDTFCTLYS